MAMTRDLQPQIAPKDSSGPDTGIIGGRMKTEQPTGTVGLGVKKRTATTYTPTTRKAYGYDPDLRDVTPEQTIQGQLPGIIGRDSKLMQQARTRALQQANERGLLSSSLAVGEAHGAVLDRAVPIAQYDAGVHERRFTDNQAYTNQAKQYAAAELNLMARDNQAAFNRALEYSAEAKNLAAQGNLEAASQIAMRELDNRTRMAVARLDANTRLKLQELTQRHERTIQNSIAAKELVMQHATNMAHIMANVRDANVRVSMYNNLNWQLEQSLSELEGHEGLANRFRQRWDVER